MQHVVIIFSSGNNMSPTTRGQKKKVNFLLSFNRYSNSSDEVISNSMTVAAMNSDLDAEAKHTNATNRVT